MPSTRRGSASETGQATVELVALMPLVALLALMLWQAAVAGQAIWLASSAAHAAARAHAVGGRAIDGARSVLPGRLEGDLKVKTERDGSVSLSLGVPFVAGPGTLTTVGSHARFVPQDG
jgi:hypothetical protein